MFVRAWKANSEEPLAKVFRRSKQLEVNSNTTDGEIQRQLQSLSKETVQRTFSLLKKRIDKLGVAQPNVTLDEARNLILVELPGIDNPQRARQFLQATAELAFWDCYITIPKSKLCSCLKELSCTLRVVNTRKLNKD